MVDAMEPETAAVVLAGMDRYYCCQSTRGNNGSPPSWSVGSPIPHPSTTDDEGRRRDRIRRRTGRRSGSAACRWPWRCWRRRGDVGSRPTPRGSARRTDPPAEPPHRRPARWSSGRPPPSARRCRAATSRPGSGSPSRSSATPTGAPPARSKRSSRARPPYGISKALAEVLERAAHAPRGQRTRRGRPATSRLLVDRSGLTRRSSRPGSACRPRSWRLPRRPASARRPR